MISKGNSSGGGQYSFLTEIVHTSGLILGAFLGGAIVITSSVGIVANVWTLVIIWSDGVNIRLQQNNGAIDVAASTTANQPSPYSFTVGCIGGGLDPLNGLIDSTQVWNRVLTAGERSTLWNGGAGI